MKEVSGVVPIEGEDPIVVLKKSKKETVTDRDAPYSIVNEHVIHKGT
jgi:hypothetical protein